MYERRNKPTVAIDFVILAAFRDKKESFALNIAFILEFDLIVLFFNDNLTRMTIQVALHVGGAASVLLLKCSWAAHSLYRLCTVCSINAVKSEVGPNFRFEREKCIFYILFSAVQHFPYACFFFFGQFNFHSLCLN